MYITTRRERETIICFSEDDKTASVYTSNAKIKRTLDPLAENGTIPKRVYDKYSAEYVVPKKWVRVRPPHKRTEKQLAAWRETLRRRGQKTDA